jgi:hypothetical protein
MKETELVSLLTQAISAIVRRDSFEGRIEYTMRPDGEFDVEAFVRVGNSEGQGSCILINSPHGRRGPQGDTGLEWCRPNPDNMPEACPKCGAFKTGSCMHCGKEDADCNCGNWEPAGCGCENEVKTLKISKEMADFLNENPY